MKNYNLFFLLNYLLNINIIKFINSFGFIIYSFDLTKYLINLIVYYFIHSKYHLTKYHLIKYYFIYLLYS